MDGRESRGRFRVRGLRELRPAERVLSCGSGVRRRTPDDGSGSRRRVRAGSTSPRAQRDGLVRARRPGAGQRLPAGQPGARLGCTRTAAADASEPGAVSAAGGVWVSALPADRSRDRRAGARRPDRGAPARPRPARGADGHPRPERRVGRRRGDVRPHGPLGVFAAPVRSDAGRRRGGGDRALRRGPVVVYGGGLPRTGRRGGRMADGPPRRRPVRGTRYAGPRPAGGARDRRARQRRAARLRPHHHPRTRVGPPCGRRGRTRPISDPVRTFVTRIAARGCAGGGPGAGAHDRLDRRPAGQRRLGAAPALPDLRRSARL